jgi:hypothetical protein
MSGGRIAFLQIFLCVLSVLCGGKNNETREKIESMTTLRIPTPLRTYTSGKSEVTVSGAKISEALGDLTTQYPAIKPHIFNEGG